MNIAPQILSMPAAALEQAADIQGRAFFDDPAFTFTFPDETSRRAGLPWLMGMGIGYGSRFGEVLTTAGTMLGHSVWLPPGRTELTDDRMAELGFTQGPERIGDDAWMRFGSFMEMASSHHHALMPGPHWYLMILGVEPARQGQGVGSALLAPMLARSDADSLPCYLETAKERNLPFYRRHGFEVRAQDAIPGGGPRVWMMVREPRRG